MFDENFQSQLFERIRKKLLPDQNLVHEIGNLLYMQKDATYRRIKGTTPLTLKELKILSNTFDISIDELLK